MNQHAQVTIVGASLLLLAGCASMETATSSYADTTSLSAPGEQKPAEQGRLLVWQANVTMTVWNISNAVASANALAEKHSGFIEDRSDGREHSASLTLRVPSRTFTAALDGLECLGDITSRYVRSKDVTEQYVDTEARLKNHAALRDRLRQLLEKATEIKDILAIESELNRVQSDIDAMEARMKSLKGKADYATIDLTFERKPVPGPLGYLCKGIWWGVEKLFIIRK